MISNLLLKNMRLLPRTCTTTPFTQISRNFCRDDTQHGADLNQGDLDYLEKAFKAKSYNIRYLRAIDFWKVPMLKRQNNKRITRENLEAYEMPPAMPEKVVSHNLSVED